MADIFNKVRDKRGMPLSLTASAARIDLSVSRQAQVKHENWQGQAWDCYDDVGEVKYAMNYLSDVGSKVKVFVAELPEAEEEPVPTKNPVAIAAGERLRAGAGGWAPLLKPAFLNLGIAGEYDLVGLKNEDGETWEVLSIDEVETENDRYTVKLEGNEKRVLTDDDFLTRIWNRHARWRMRADSSLRGVLSSCEELLLIDQSIRANARSRLTSGKIMLVPEELSFPGEKEKEGDEESDPFMAQLEEAMLTPIMDEGHASAVVPIVLRGSAESIKEFRIEDLGRNWDEALDKRTERALRRLAQGLPVPPEVVLGTAGINHWGVWGVEDAAIGMHMEPAAITVMEGFTKGYLHIVLKAAQVPNFENYFFWYDASGLSQSVNPEQDAKDAHDRNVISDAALRRALRMDEADAPPPEELAARREAKRPVANPSPGQGPPAQEEEEAENDAPIVASANGTKVKGKPLGHKLADIDRDLRTRLQVAAHNAVKRTLERAGSKAITAARSSKDSRFQELLKGVEKTEVLAALGPTIASTLGFEAEPIISESFEELKVHYFNWTRQAQEAAIRLIPKVTDDQKASIRLKQSADREQGWEWLNERLGAYASRRLYSPKPKYKGGEQTDLLVPMGLIRQSLAIAGGATGYEHKPITAALAFEDFEDEGLFVINGGRDIPGEVATGDYMQQLFREQGITVLGYVFDYGSSPRFKEFEPHKELDGVEFLTFSDEVLRNTESWPPVDYYSPGDHNSCMCSALPLFKETTETL